MFLWLLIDNGVMGGGGDGRRREMPDSGAALFSAQAKDLRLISCPSDVKLSQQHGEEKNGWEKKLT